MHSPYYASPFLATLILLGVTGALLSLYTAQLRLTSRGANRLLHAAIWASACAPLAPGGAYGVGGVTMIALCIHIAGLRLVRSPRRVVAFGISSGAALVAGFLLAPGSEHELVLLSLFLQAGHLAWHTRPQAPPDAAPLPSPSSPPERTLLAVDAATFVIALVAGLCIAHFVLLRLGDSGDEWSYTFQAALFAKGRAFGNVPDCLSSVRMFWVFWKESRFFSMYTPGWPLFMTPFVAMGAPWAAGPVSLALLVVAVGRLGRRGALALSGEAPVAIFAGVTASALTLTSSGVLLMGASRYPHVFVAALWAAAAEFTCILHTRQAAPWRSSVAPALALGLCLSWLLAARPAEGALFGGPILVCLALLARRRRLRLSALAFVGLGVLPVGLLSLLILRLQLGEWFRTGYDLNKVIYPWNNFARSLPSPRELKWHVPLVTGGYCWMPLTPALGLAGLLALTRTRAASIAWVLGIGSATCLLFFFTLATGRGMDAGYSPRYQFALVVPMAVGAACAFARAHAYRRTFLLTATIGALSLGAIWPLSMPVATADIRQRNPAQVVAERDGIHGAIIFLREGTGTAPPEDAPQNLPFEFYPPDVVYAIDRGPEARACLQAQFPGKKPYILTPELRLQDL